MKAFPILICSLLMAISAAAADWQGFKVVRTSGDCRYLADGQYKAVQQGQTFDFGTTVQTGRRSILDLQFSPENTFRLLSRTRLRIVQDVASPKLKRMELSQGQIELKLDKVPEGTKLEVQTPTAVCGALGTRFTVSFEAGDAKQGSRAAEFSVDEGEVYVASNFQVGEKSVQGQAFRAGSVGAGSAIAAVIHEGRENSYADIAVNRGEVAFDFGDPEGGNRFVVKPSGAGKRSRFTAALEKSAKETEVVAVSVKEGVLRNERKKRGLFGTKTETTEVKPDDGDVVVKNQRVYAHKKGNAVADYLAAAKEEGELHSQLVVARNMGNQPLARELDRKVEAAADRASRLRRQLLNRRTIDLLNKIRRGTRPRIPRR